MADYTISNIIIKISYQINPNIYFDLNYCTSLLVVCSSNQRTPYRRNVKRLLTIPINRQVDSGHLMKIRCY